MASAATPIDAGVWRGESVTVWDLQAGRGVQSLRELNQPITKLCLSPDSKKVAALSQSLQIGVWSVANGQLQCVLDAPPSAFADNAAIAFNSDGSQLAFTSGTTAKVWERVAQPFNRRRTPARTRR